MRAFLASLWILLASLLLISCGGGGSDGVFTDRPLSLDVSLEKETLWVNTAQSPAQLNSPYVSRVDIQVRPASAASITVDYQGTQGVGGFLTEDQLIGGGNAPQPSVALTAASNGAARVYFVAGTSAGDATIRIRANYTDASGNFTAATANRSIRVRSDAGPASTLTFTGPFIEAIRSNRVDFDLANGESQDFQNGTYSRVISVTLRDANGNPVPVNTPVYFRLIDAPLDGFPNEGSGRFAITGTNADPQEGGYALTASNGDFINRGARIGDRIVLHPNPDSRSFFHQGIRTIVQLPPSQPNRLLIAENERTFNVGENQAGMVPYTIGRAQAGSIQPMAFTDTTGTASTMLTYPFSHVGRTAIIVAHTEDQAVSSVFNPGGPVYLGVPWWGMHLTTSTTVLPSNAQATPVTLCLRDANFVPLVGERIQFATSDTQGAQVDVNGLGAAGALTAGAGGCATATVNIQGQLPGHDQITVTFFAETLGQREEVEVTILAPGVGNLVGSLSCEAGRANVSYLTDNGSPIPGALVQVEGISWGDGTTDPRFRFDPEHSSGNAGITNADGSVSISFELGTAPGTYEATVVTLNPDDVSFPISCTIADTDLPTVSLVGEGATLVPGGQTSLAVSLNAPAPETLVVNLQVTGDREDFIFPTSVTIPTGGTTINFDVRARPSAPDGATIQLGLSAGEGYALGNAGPLSFTVDGSSLPITVGSIVLLASSPTLSSSSQNPVTLTALVRDSRNVLMADVPVQFSADSGTLRVTRAVTDDSGTAQAELTSAEDRRDRDIRITAAVGQQRGEVTVRVVGTRISFAGRSTGIIGDQISLTMTLRDSEGNPLPNQPLNLQATAGLGLSTTTPMTNVAGQATVVVTLNAAGEQAITARFGDRVSETFSIRVADALLEFIEPDPTVEGRPEVPVNTDVAVRVRLTVNNQPVANEPIRFTATRGTFTPTPATVLTNASGEAEVSIRAADAGSSAITVSSDSGASAELEVLFVATQAQSMTLQASPAVIGTNALGESDQQSQIIAVVRDPNNNLVKGKRINFTLSDISGGRLSTASATTDEFGRATVTYFSGNAPSAQNGVVVTAVVQDTPTVQSTVRLTVARSALFITLGTGDTIEKEGEVRYRKPYSVLVTDVSGNPVSNANVSLEVVPTAYSRGIWCRIGDDPWFPVVGEGPIPAQDPSGLAGGGIVPGNAVTLSAANVTTDATGFADFQVVYFEIYGIWLDVVLTARTPVAGSEAVRQVNFTLPIAAADARSEQGPAGNPSPFGRGGAVCP